VEYVHRSRTAWRGEAFTPPRLPPVSGVGGFANDNYWSSSENNATNAWNQNFNNGNQNNNNKTNNNRVRPVRGFHRDRMIWRGGGAHR